MSDNISREAAIEAIQNAYCKPCKERGDDHNEVRCRVCEYDNAIIQIDALPSAELTLQTPQTYGKSINPSNAEVVADYISRADVIEAVRMSEHRITIADEQGGFGTVKWDMWGVYTAEAVEAIKALPSADAVEVVRCGECKYKRLYDDGDTKYYYCALEDRPNRNWSVDDTDYCSWGERKEE